MSIQPMTRQKLGLAAAIMSGLLFITGCQNTTPMSGVTIDTVIKDKGMSGANATAAKAVIDNKTLGRYDWTLVSAVDSNNKSLAPLTAIKDQVTLNFAEQNGTNTVGFSVGCNRMGGSYEIASNILMVKDVISTQMFCQDLDAAEKLLSSVMQGDSQLSYTAGSVPVLTLIDSSRANKATLVWQGKMKADAKYQQKGETIFWAVDHKAEPCANGSSKKCLKVKPVTYNEQGVKTDEGSWMLFSGEIQGFTHDATQDQVLRLKRYTVAPSDVKGKQFAYVLDMVVESQMVK